MPSETKRLFPTGRLLLAVGGAMLLVGVLVLPWFSIGGQQADFPPGDYDAYKTSDRLNVLSDGPWAWLAYAYLFVVVILAFLFAGLGRKISNFGTSGILVLLLYAILVYVAIDLINRNATGGLATFGIAYGFVVAFVGTILIEVGSRLTKVAPPAPVPAPTPEAAEEPTPAPEEAPPGPAAPPPEP